MIVPRHVTCAASFSSDADGPDGRGKYRHTLWRRNLLDDDPGAYAEFWDRYVMFLCLNPSTATETLDDPTVRQSWMRVRRWGYGSFVMANLFDFRATEPERMKAQPDPVSEWCDEWLWMTALGANKIVLAWGCDGAHRNRDIEVLRLLERFRHRMFYLTLTAQGFPSHPLYKARDLKPSPVEPIWKNLLQRRAA